MIVFDGHEYENVADVPDLGSFHNDKLENGKRNYYGLSADVAKLPTKAEYPQYTDLKTGSIAYCIDTGAVYMYEESSDTWYAQ